MKVIEMFENWLKTNSNATTKDAYMEGFHEGLRCEYPSVGFEEDKKYTYFISFTHSYGTGNCCWELQNKMNPESLINIKKELEENNSLKEVCINNFILLDE